METATFFCDHAPSQSRAVIEFAANKRQVYILGVGFIKGNVIDLNVVRACLKRAKYILVFNRG